MSQAELEKLVKQATIVSTMMLTLSKSFHGDYRRKHVGAVWEDLLVAFVLWHSDTVTHPMTVANIVTILGIPRSNVDRALGELIAGGLVCRINRRYARNIDFIAMRHGSAFFVDIRTAVVAAGRALETVFD